MKSRFALPDSFTKRRIQDMEVVTTIPRPPSRDWGKYESAGLPDIDLLLERTLNDIERAHVIRDRSSRDFDKLWSKVCRGLELRHNATSFEHWKNASIARKNIRAKSELEKRLGDLLAKRFSIDRQEDADLGRECDEAYEAALNEYETFDAKSKVSTDDILEVAIAYWIEAVNARKNHDDLRCLHALIECWTNIGKTRSAKTESEAKSDAGAKRGTKLRDAVALMVTRELSALKVTKEMTDPTYLVGVVVINLQRDPPQAKILADYDAQAIAGKRTTDEPKDRISATIIKWATAKKPRYPELAAAYAQALRQAQDIKSPRSRK